MELTQEEKDFLKNLLNTLQLNPANKDAIKTVGFVQSILEKINS